jgi:hypothetical protein
MPLLPRAKTRASKKKRSGVVMEATFDSGSPLDPQVIHVLDK